MIDFVVSVVCLEFLVGGSVVGVCMRVRVARGGGWA